MALRIESLHKFQRGSRGEVAILQDLSFAVEEGAFFAIMGPSGSGKSTLLHLLCGLDSPSAGRVLLAGRDLAPLGEKGRALLRRREIGLVFQFFNLVPNLTVRENIALPLRIQGRARRQRNARVAELLATLGLEEHGDYLPHQLSGGEMQRVSIARALAAAPRILLADEPTGNLASGQGEEIMKLLRGLCDERGQTIVLVTHNPRDAAYGDEVRFLLDGRLLADPVLRDAGVTADSVHACLRRLAI